MGRIFSPPKSPSPPPVSPPPVPPAPEPEDGGTETEAQKEARKKQQKAAALAKGRSSTIFSGSQGDTSQATVKKATLLGE